VSSDNIQKEKKECVRLFAWVSHFPPFSWPHFAVPTELACCGGPRGLSPFSLLHAACTCSGLHPHRYPLELFPLDVAVAVNLQELRVLNAQKRSHSNLYTQ
jgi:hypothetical protein